MFAAVVLAESVLWEKQTVRPLWVLLLTFQDMSVGHGGCNIHELSQLAHQAVDEHPSHAERDAE